MKKFFAATALAVLASFGLVVSAQASIIDFEGIAGRPGTGTHAARDVYTLWEGPPAIVQGFAFVSEDWPGFSWVYVSGDLSARIGCFGYASNCAANGSDYLLAGSDSLSIRRSGGGAFDLNALDLGNWFDSSADDSAPARTTFQLTGRQAGGGAIEHTVTLDDVPNYISGPADDLNHFAFSDFRSIESLDIAVLTTRTHGGLVLDNLDVTVAGAAVPEPASLALVGLGMAGLARRRRRP